MGVDDYFDMMELGNEEDAERHEYGTGNTKMGFGKDYSIAFSFDKARVDRETEKALFVILHDGSSHWIPKSVVHDNSEVYKEGHSGKLVVKGWFAKKEHLDVLADDEEEGR